jgi:hypothetical protein
VRWIDDEFTSNRGFSGCSTHRTLESLISCCSYLRWLKLYDRPGKRTVLRAPFVPWFPNLKADELLFANARSLVRRRFFRQGLNLLLGHFLAHFHPQQGP